MDHVWLKEDFVLKTITDDKLSELMSRYTPLIKSGDKIRTIEVPHPRNIAFTWDPKPLETVKFESLYQIRTVHSCGYHAFFKPSISEVLAAVQDHPEILEDERVNGFYIDTSLVEVYSSGEGHNAVTHFGQFSQEIA